MSSFPQQLARLQRLSSHIRPTTAISRRQLFHSTTRTPVVTSSAGQAISETAKQEGGPHKGSTSAQMQSQIGKQRNLEHAAAEIGSKMQNAPETVTSEDAADIHSREARATGIQNPPAGSLSSQAEALAAANEGRTDSSNNGAAAAANNTVPADPAQKSQQHRVQNFEQASEQVTSKMANAPEQVTKEEGDLLHSREQRAFGATSKGGVASQAQSLAAENEKRGGTTA